MRDTDRKRVSEAVRLSGAWLFQAYGDEHYVSRATNPSERLVIRYGKAGQIVEAWHNWPGCRNGIIIRKGERVLAIIEGKR